jgi:hypothetical protein
MSILGAVTNEVPRTGIRAVISGVEKAGKTTLCCNAPRPLLVPLEMGTATIKVHKTPMLTHWDHVIQLLDETTIAAQQGQFPFQTIIFDSATALERLIHQAVIEMDPSYGKGNKKAVTMESALGGYGKAYTYANEKFGDFLAKCDALAIYGGINIILTCHVFAAEVVDPSVGTYNTWDLLLHSPKNQKTYGKREMITQWADLIGYLHEPILITEVKNGKDSMNLGVSSGQGRILGVSRQPGYVAGNRFHLTEPIPIPAVNGWNALAHEIFNKSGVDIYNRDVTQ